MISFKNVCFDEGHVDILRSTAPLSGNTNALLGRARQYRPCSIGSICCADRSHVIDQRYDPCLRRTPLYGRSHQPVPSCRFKFWRILCGNRSRRWVEIPLQAAKLQRSFRHRSETFKATCRSDNRTRISRSQDCPTTAPD